MQKVSQISFNGNFNYNKLKPKQSKKLQEMLSAKYDGKSGEQLLKDMPFDVDVVCFNPTKKAIHPRFGFYIQHKKKQATLIGNIRLSSKNQIEQNAEKLNKFITNFNNKLKSLKGDERITSAEETQRQVDMILFNRF